MMLSFSSGVVTSLNPVPSLPESSITTHFAMEILSLTFAKSGTQGSAKIPSP